EAAESVRVLELESRMVMATELVHVLALVWESVLILVSEAESALIVVLASEVVLIAASAWESVLILVSESGLVAEVVSALASERRSESPWLPGRRHRRSLSDRANFASSGSWYRPSRRPA